MGVVLIIIILAAYIIGRLKAKMAYLKEIDKHADIISRGGLPTPADMENLLRKHREAHRW